MGTFSVAQSNEPLQTTGTPCCSFRVYCLGSGPVVARKRSKGVEELFMAQLDVHAILELVDAWLSQLGRCDTPALRRVRQSLARTLTKAGPSLVLAVADALVKRGSWADRLLAYETVAGHRSAFAALDEPRVIRWSEGLADWGTVDLFGCTLAGQVWRQGPLSDTVVDTWSRSPDRWRRRLALVCTVPLNSKARGGGGDATRTLRICEALVDDRDDMVVKALSWALRELGKRDAGAVRRFLSQNQDRVASRVRREVTNKLVTGKKTIGRGRPEPHGSLESVGARVPR
jgi:3-methyladenine DNA glycosylase AlkD